MTKRLNRRSDENGAALVEAAIILVPLCLLLFGIIEFGFIFKDSLTLSSATRAGARTASAEPQAGGQLLDAWAAVSRADSAITPKPGDTLTFFIANAAGDPPATCNAANKCTQVQGNAGGAWNTPPSGSPGVWWENGTNENACVGTAKSFGVQIKYQHNSLTGFFNPLNLTEKTVMRLEPLTSDCGS